MTLADRLRASLAATKGNPARYSSDLREAVGNDGTPAAVLIAITDRPEPGLILTQRPDTMRSHAGQVAFPGGRVDPGDVDAIAAALREAEEEVALPPSKVDIVGVLEPYRTITGFNIAPVVAVIPADLPLVPHDAEVAAVFEVPLAFVLDQANFREQHVTVGPRQRTYIEAMWGERRIWGATAAMLANLSARLAW
ncbi:MAG: CoA pyrophosphatase [Sphingomonadales bacterium]